VLSATKSRTHAFRAIPWDHGLGMPKESKIVISKEVADRCDGPNQFERFNALVGKVLSVPMSTIREREMERQFQASLNPRRRGPKPKNRGGASRVASA
jgi:hypothetical protein